MSEQWTPYTEMAKWRRRFWALLFFALLAGLVLVKELSR